MTHLSEIMQRGYAHLPHFLTDAEVLALANDYRHSQFNSTAYTLGFATPAAIDPFRQRIQNLIDELGQTGEFTPRQFGGGAYFATEKGINFGWHQDHESYFINQTHRNYLNIYIPIIKPDSARTNLSLVPIDRFKENAPDAWAKLEWGGAATAVYEHGKTRISDDNAGGLHAELDFALDEIKVTPHLSAGDALLIRGDMFHRTQDNDTDRVALSIRAFDPTLTVQRQHFIETCKTKDWFKSVNPMYQAIDSAFEAQESFVLGDLMARVHQAAIARQAKAQEVSP